MGRREYFKFTLDSYKKLSKGDLLDMFISGVKNNTLDTTLSEYHYLSFLYLFDKGYTLNDIDIRISPNYRLIDNNDYIELFSFNEDKADSIIHTRFHTICLDEITSIVNKLNEQEINDIIEELNEKWTSSYYENTKDIIELYTNKLILRCKKAFNNKVSDMDEVVTRFIKSLKLKQRHIMLRYYNQLIDFFTNEFKCMFTKYNIYSPISYNDYYKYKRLYESLKV